MSDRVVYVCGCDDDGACMIGMFEPWFPHTVGRICPDCNQPVTAINIDHLERIQAAAKHVIEACRGDECDILGPLAFDKLIEAVEEGE